VIDISTIDAKIRELRELIKVLQTERNDRLANKPGVDIILGDASWTPAQREEAIARLAIVKNPMPKAAS
jgi:predicted nuclease with TOPRIM domain